jgi:hypothetical protein
MLILSLEPWADPRISPNPSTLLPDVIAEKYDQPFRRLALKLVSIDILCRILADES